MLGHVFNRLSGMPAVIRRAKKTENYLLKRARSGSSNRLVVVFSSVNSNGFSFYKLFSQRSDLDVLFLRDPNDQWYSRGLGEGVSDWQQLCEAVSETISKRNARDVLAFGSSMGGYAALRLAADLKLSHCLATSPQTILDPRLPHAPANRIKGRGYDLKEDIENRLEANVVLYFGAADIVDIYNVWRVNWPRTTTLVPVADQDHLVAAHLTRTGCYDALIATFAETGSLDQVTRKVAVDAFLSKIDRDVGELVEAVIGCCYLDAPGDIRALTARLLQYPGNWADALRLTAVSLARSSKYAAAIEYAREAAYRAPLSITIADTYASCLAGGGHEEAAIEAYRRCLAIRPKHYAALCALAELFAARGDIPQARDLLNNAVDLRPRLTRAQTLLARIDTEK